MLILLLVLQVSACLIRLWHSARLLESSWADTALLELFETLQEDVHFEP